MDKPPARNRKGVAKKDRRKDRLAEQLRANLQKRKAQARSRRIGEADQRPDGLGAAKDTKGLTEPADTGPTVEQSPFLNRSRLIGLDVAQLEQLPEPRSRRKALSWIASELSAATR